MKHLIAFLLLVSTGLNCLTAVSAMTSDPTEPEGNETKEIVVRILSSDSVREVAKAAVPSPLPENCSEEMYNNLQKIKEAVGEGFLMTSIGKVGKKDIDTISSATHFLLILGAWNNGFTAAIAFLKFIHSNNIKPKVTVVLTKEFLENVKVQSSQMPGAQNLKMKHRFVPILDRIKELVGADNYKEFQEEEEVDPTAKILKWLSPQEETVETEKTVAIDGLTGAGNDATIVWDDKAFGIKLVDTLIQNPHVLVIGHDGSSCFGSTFGSSKQKVRQADIVFNTTRAQHGQSCEGLVILADMNTVLKGKQNGAGFTTKYDRAGKIKVALVSAGADFPYNLLKNPFVDIKIMKQVFDAIKLQIFDYTN